jgi:hypothetical protein
MISRTLNTTSKRLWLPRCPLTCQETSEHQTRIIQMGIQSNQAMCSLLWVPRPFRITLIRTETINSVFTKPLWLKTLRLKSCLAQSTRRSSLISTWPIPIPRLKIKMASFKALSTIISRTSKILSLSSNTKMKKRERHPYAMNTILFSLILS